MPSLFLPLALFRQLTKPSSVFLGETAGSNDPEILLKYIRPERKELDTVFVRLSFSSRAFRSLVFAR